MNELNIWPGSYFTEDSENDLLMTKDENQTINTMIGEKCSKICGTNIDCLREYFTFGDQSLTTLLKTYFEILITIPSHPTLLIIHSAKIEFEEFLCYITSIISLWFGFSVIMFIDVFEFINIFTSKIIDKYKAKISIITNLIIVKKRSEIITNQRPD
jgi:hypothetical protein